MTERKLSFFALENAIYDWNFHFLRERMTGFALEFNFGHVSRAGGPFLGILGVVLGRFSLGAASGTKFLAVFSHESTRARAWVLLYTTSRLLVFQY
jgi:hypothetical protein